MGGCLSKKDQDTGAQPKPEETEEAAAPKTEEPAKDDEAAPAAAAAAPEPASGDKVAEDTPAKPEEPPASSSKPVVFILGASGKVGSATLKFLSEEFADKVEIRAGVRHPEGADAIKSLPGVTLVQASMAEKDPLVSVLSGVDVLYIVVPGAENRTELSGIAADAAKEAGIKHVAVVSVPTAGLEDTTFGKQFGAIEEKITGLDIPYTILRLPLFMDNLLGAAATVKESAQFFYPVSGDKPYTVVDPDDVGKASAAVLADPSKHAGKTYNVVSSRITNDGFATALSSILEKEVTYVKSEVEDTKQTLLGFGLPEWQVDGILDLYRLIEENSPRANPENIGDFKEITGEDPESMEEYLTQYAAIFKE